MKVGVIGGGVVGLACAEELVRAGHEVRVFDPHPGGGASRAAAGMLAPGGEAWHGEDDLLRFGLSSARLWPSYAWRLQAGSGIDVDLRTAGTLLVGHDPDDLAVVRRTLRILERAGVAFRELDRGEVRVEEPGLAGVAGAAVVPGDHHVDPRRVCRALLRLLGGRVVLSTARIDGPGLLGDDGSRFDCEAVVLATGAWPHDLTPLVRPVQGETIRLRVEDPPRRVLRGRAHGEAVYVVPRAGGEVVVGATEEEHQAEPRASVGAVVRLLHAARTLLPGLETAEVLEITARHRPGTPDNGPLIGPLTARGRTRVVAAVGHYRGGVLLAPATARAVRAHVEGNEVPAPARPFSPDRFGPALSHASTPPTTEVDR